MKKIKNPHIIIIIAAIAIIAIIAIIVSRKGNQKLPIYTSLDQISSVGELINQRYGEYIKEEASKDQKFNLDIYTNLTYNLYENEESKKYFYDRLITDVSIITRYQSFRIIDETKQVIVRVIGDIENREISYYDINGNPYFYAHYESMRELANYKKIQETALNIDSTEVNTLISNDWLLNSLKLGTPDFKQDNEEIYGNMNITKINKEVFNIVFYDTYKTSIVNGIKVGESFENIINILGTPTFGNAEDLYIGYKGQDIYVFFSNTETGPQISVYSVQKSVESDGFVKLLEEFNKNINNNDKNALKKMVSALTDYWTDYDYYNYNENMVDLWYSLNGIKVQFDVSDNNGIIVYNNYLGKVIQNYTQEELKDMEIEIPNFIFFTSKDSINEYESTRVQKLNYDIEMPEDEF